MGRKGPDCKLGPDVDERDWVKLLPGIGDWWFKSNWESVRPPGSVTRVAMTSREQAGGNCKLGQWVSVTEVEGF